MLFAFWRLEHRGADPIADFALFRNGPYFGASVAAFALVGAYWAVMFFQPQYLQDVRQHTPIAVALAATGAVFHALLDGGDSFAAAIAGSTWVPVALCAVGTVLTWTFVRDPERPGPDPSVAGDPPLDQLRHHRHHRRFHL